MTRRTRPGGSAAASTATTCRSAATRTTSGSGTSRCLAARTAPGSSRPATRPCAWSGTESCRRPRPIRNGRRCTRQATVYEQASQLTEVGAGVVVAPNAARLLRALGVLDALAAKAVRLETGWEFRRWQDGSVLSAEDLATECERRFGEHTYTAHRA